MSNATKKRYAWKFSSRDGTDVEINGMSRHKPSPIAEEGEPLWIIDFHARERKGGAFVSGSQVASLHEMGTAIALWILSVCKAQGASASEYASRIASAVRSAEGGITLRNKS